MTLPGLNSKQMIEYFREKNLELPMVVWRNNGRTSDQTPQKGQLVCGVYDKDTNTVTPRSIYELTKEDLKTVKMYFIPDNPDKKILQVSYYQGFSDSKSAAWRDYYNGLVEQLKMLYNKMETVNEIDIPLSKRYYLPDFDFDDRIMTFRGVKYPI